MKRFVVIFSFLFLLIPFSFPSFISAQPVTSTSTATASASTQPSWWDSFWAWITGIFIKTDYSISQRSPDEIISDQNNYSIASDSSKHSSQGTRLTDSASQTCYKGSVIKKTISNTSGYSDSHLAYLCSDSSTCTVSKTDSSCEDITIKDLAVYFVQLNKRFYCDDKNNLINIDSNVVSSVAVFLGENSSPIPNNNLDCYQKIYKDFYLVPKDTTDSQEENSKKIIQTPVSANSQKDSNTNSDELQKNLDQNISPKGTSAGLDGLRYAGQ